MRCVALLILGVLLATNAHAAGLSDSIDTSDSASLAAHHFAGNGSVSAEITGDFVGGHDTRRVAHVARGEKSSLSYTLRVEPNRPITIEIEEMCGRERDVRANVVLVDDRKVYLRTWEGNGAGPVHYFVQAPPTSNDHVTLKLISCSDAPFAISRVWAFCDFDAYFAANHVDIPLFLAPTVSLKWNDFDADLAKVRKIRDLFGEHPNARPAWTTWIAYARWSDEQIATNIDYLLKLAATAQLPLHTSFDSWWANTPDGKWRETKYQQVVYNATAHKMQLSVPNQWSNTPWLTMNDPELNAFKTQRLTSALRIFRERYRAMNDPTLVIAISLDNEPIYWASGNAGLGDDELWADFSAGAIADARRAGVTLDPTDGLSREERLWLWRNLLAYQEMIGRCAVETLGDELLRNDVYTQAMIMSRPSLQYPMFDAAFPLWEHGAPASVRCGGEWNGNSMAEIESVMHQIALGRNANTNAECGNNPRECRCVASAYALGQRFVALYNYPLDQMHVAAGEVDDLSRSFAPFPHEPVLLEHDFTNDTWKQQTVSSNNIAIDRIGNTVAMAAHPASATEPGIIEYSLRAPRGTFDGLAIELSGRAFVYQKSDPRVNIRVLAGDPLVELGAITDAEDMKDVHRIDLSNAARGKDRVNIRIELNALGLEKQQLSRVAIDHVRFTTPWPREWTEELPPQDVSLKTSRKQSLVVSWRADAEAEIAKMPAIDRAEAQRDFDRGDYVQAYTTACRSRD